MVEPRSDSAVPAFWQGLGLPGLIDAHVHFMPQRLMSAVWGYFDEAGPLIGTEWPIRYRDSEEERLALLRGLGVRAFPSLLYPHRPGMAESLNEWAAGFAARVPECVQTATFFPEPGVEDYAARAVDAGARVFKVHLQVGGFDPRAKELDPVWGTLADAGVPALVHAGSGPVANGYTGPGPFGEVLARHPRLTAIVAHLGAPEFEGFFALADRYERVCLDTTMIFTRFAALAPFPDALMPRLRDLGLAGRVLLGTDFPNIPYEYAHQLESLAALGLGDDWLRAVCWHGPARLFGLA
ncbi:amidohydrolase family protein [Actinomadura syzygii]|uniref:Amidohydrolase n=1 Tax=Actinomadura syzygii TaxID=1427538 RepID=A0A5D0U5N1_9ACTN|nr:amidohydrolase family protein [Actinomadura syzygii]TYC12299.1 amidohydrolase [Actinomadura syzygii]